MQKNKRTKEEGLHEAERGKPPAKAEQKPTLFAELKRRRVLTFTAGYIVSAWLVIEVASVVLPAFEAPDWVLRFMIIGAVSATPIAIILAWFFDLTRQGVMLTGDKENDTSPLTPELAVPPAEEEEEEEDEKATAETRLITILQCSTMPGSAAGCETDIEQFRRDLPDLMAHYITIIERYGGYLAPSEGELFTAYFGVEVAHEDTSLRAVHSAQEILAQVERFNTTATSQVEVNIGLHCGFAIIEPAANKRVDEWVSNIGHTLKSVAALQITASSNEIRISQDIYGLVQERVSCEQVGSLQLPGTHTTNDVFRITTETLQALPIGAGPESSIIGREQELALLNECWDNTLNAQGQVVLLRGDAGIGKSRLVESLLATVESQENTTAIVLHCSAYHSHSSLYPVVHFLQQHMHLADLNSNEKKLAHIERYLSAHNLDPDTLLPSFASLMSLEHSNGIATWSRGGKNNSCWKHFTI